jgi:hypothetical protein
VNIRDKLDELEYLDYYNKVSAGQELKSRQWELGVIGIAEVILSVAVYFMLVFFVLIMAIDILYFYAPPVQGWVDDIYDNKEPNKFTKVLISQRARLSMEESYKTGRNVAIIYMIKMVPMFFMASIALGFTVGNLDLLFYDFIYKMADILVGVLETFSRG